MPHVNCTASCEGVFKFLMKALRSQSPEWGMMETSGSGGWWEGKTFFSFPFRFLLCLAWLYNYLKYPENHHERLRTRQVNWMLLMKSLDLVTFLVAGIWSNDGWVQQSDMDKILFKAIEKYRYGFRKTVSKHLKWRKSKMTSDEYLMAWHGINTIKSYIS